MEAVEVNLTAIFTGAAVYFLIGILWYSPKLFGRAWKELTGMDTGDARGRGGYGMYLSTFILLLLLTYVLAHVLAYVAVTTVGAAAITGIWLWLGFVITTMAVNAMYAGRPQKLVLIDAGYHLLGITAAAITMALWL